MTPNSVRIKSTLATGNTTITGFANVSTSINTASFTVGTNFIANSTGITTTGFANVSSTLRVSGVTTFSGNVVLGSSGLSANGGFGSAGQVLSSNGTAAYWTTAAATGVTSVAAANGLNGGTITSTGTISVLGGSTLTVNSVGAHVNSALSITSLTLAGTASGITTLAAGNTTITGFANVSTSVNSALLTVGTSFIANTTGAYHTGTVNAASHTVGSSFIANSTGITSTGFANVSTSVNAASHTVGTSFIANSTSITSTGFANVSTSVNSALLTVGTNFIANTTQVTLGTGVKLSANGSVGTAGQVLASNGATGSPYWVTAGGGADEFARTFSMLGY